MVDDEAVDVLCKLTELEVLVAGFVVCELVLADENTGVVGGEVEDDRDVTTEGCTDVVSAAGDVVCS